MRCEYCYENLTALQEKNHRYKHGHKRNPPPVTCSVDCRRNLLRRIAAMKEHVG